MPTYPSTAGDESGTLGLTIKTGTKTSRMMVSEADAIKEDLKNCGEETRLDDYEDMPIAEFGMALMRGMGWKDGEALGGSRKGILEPIEVSKIPRPESPKPHS